MLKLELTESETNLITQGLDLLLIQKRAALTQASTAAVNFDFAQEDFGIPQIMNLFKKIEEAI